MSTSKVKTTIFLVTKADKEILGFVNADSAKSAREIAGSAMGICDYENIRVFSTYFPKFNFIHARWLIHDMHEVK